MKYTKQDTNNIKLNKIREARNMIIIPLLITVICAWIDIWTNYTAGGYSNGLISDITSVIRCCMGYLFPSLVSIIIAMIVQQINGGEESYGVEKAKLYKSVIFTALYATVFISCLINYTIFSAVFLCIVTVVYIWWFYEHGLDRAITHKNKEEMTQDELILNYLNGHKF